MGTRLPQCHSCPEQLSTSSAGNKQVRGINTRLSFCCLRFGAQRAHAPSAFGWADPHQTHDPSQARRLSRSTMAHISRRRAVALLADVDDDTSPEEASSWALPLARWSEAWRPSVRTAHCAEVEQVLLATGPLCLSTAVLNSCLVRGLARLAGRGECPTHRIRRLSRRGQWCGRW